MMIDVKKFSILHSTGILIGFAVAIFASSLIGACSPELATGTGIATIIITLLSTIYGIYINSEEVSEKAAIFLSDINNWDSDHLFYKQDSNCKIEFYELQAPAPIKFQDAAHYLMILRDSCLSEDIWHAKRRRIDCSGEEGLTFFSVALKYKTTVLRQFIAVQIILKHYPAVGDCNVFFLPANLTSLQKRTKEDIVALDEFSVCKLLYKKSNGGQDGGDKVLNYLNYSYLDNPGRYLESNCKLLYDTNRD